MGLGLNQVFGYAFGAVYVAIGMLGFAVTGGLDFAATEGAELLIFDVNPLHNVVHIGIGGLLLAAAASGARDARLMNIVIGAAYLAVGIAGFFLVDTDTNYLALDQADNGLHIASAALALAVGVLQREPARA